MFVLCTGLCLPRKPPAKCTSAAPGRRFPSGGQASEEPKPAATLGIAEAQDCLAERPIILAVGRLVEKKGYPYLIEACRILASRGYDFRCLIVGGGPQEPLLRKLIGQGSPADASSAENDLSESVKMVGRVFQQDLLDYLEQADVFCLPCVVASDGDMDGIPNTLMEAMAMEIPTVSTTISGIPELIQDGRTGLLVPPKDAVALAEAIAALLDNNKLGYALGKAGRIRVMEEFEIGKNVDRLVDIFAACIGDSTET